MLTELLKGAWLVLVCLAALLLAGVVGRAIGGAVGFVAAFVCFVLMLVSAVVLSAVGAAYWRSRKARRHAVSEDHLSWPDEEAQQS
ncbi:MAG: hypothetical protein ACYTEZ_13570 [Planctomycetota bacterium]|jgi:hypothetical protein